MQEAGLGRSSNRSEIDAVLLVVVIFGCYLIAPCTAKHLVFVESGLLYKKTLLDSIEYFLS